MANIVVLDCKSGDWEPVDRRHALVMCARLDDRAGSVKIVRQPAPAGGPLHRAP